MAKKRATKAAGKSTAGAKRNPPAMYPDPAPIQIATPQKVVAFDPKTRLITLQGPPPPEMVAAAELQQWLMNLSERLCNYCENCLERMEPYWGKRPEHVPRTQWLDKKMNLELPEHTTGDTGDTLLALKVMQDLVAHLEASGPISPNIRRALCLAIDLGQLLQRGQTQRDYGETVETGRIATRSRSVATEANSLGKKNRIEAALAEFNRRMAMVNGTRKTNQTLVAMSKVKDANGKPLWGSIATLNRYAEHWKSITPSK